MTSGNISYTLAAMAAGTLMAEKHGEAQDKAAQTSNAFQRARESVDRAEKAESSGMVRDDSAETGDRDADGRRAWERFGDNKKRESGEQEKSRDTTGKVGKTLDISG